MSLPILFVLLAFCALLVAGAVVAAVRELVR